MDFYLFTYDGHGYPIAKKMMEEGHNVIAGVVQDKKDFISPNGDSEKEDLREKELRLSLYQNMMEMTDAWKLVEKIKNLKSFDDTFVFFDLNNLFRFSDELKNLPVAGNFVTVEDLLFEEDRDKAKNFVSQHYPKMRVATKIEFKKAKEAIDFLEKTDEIWVLKGFNDKAKAVVPDVDDPELAGRQIIEALRNHKEVFESLGFMLELLIPNIVELTPEKFYYDGVPLGTSIDIENKPFGSGNIGVQTGCSADLVFPTDMEDRINKIAFPPAIDEMAKEHKGLFVWDASLLIDKSNGKIHFGEFCSNRLGYNSFFSELAQTASVAGFFRDCMDKKNPYRLGTVATSLRIFNMNRDQNQQIRGGIRIDYKPEIEKYLWLWDVRKEGDKLVSVGYDWNLAVITGAGKSINEAIQRMYKSNESFSFLGEYYRPQDDYLSLDYPTSILNRLNYGVERGLYRLPFSVKVGDIKIK